jgi:hypothetical protein
MSEVERHSNELHPSIYFMIFINPYSPLPDSHVVHIFILMKLSKGLITDLKIYRFSIMTCI